MCAVGVAADAEGHDGVGAESCGGEEFADGGGMGVGGDRGDGAFDVTGVDGSGIDVELDDVDDFVSGPGEWGATAWSMTSSTSEVVSSCGSGRPLVQGCSGAWMRRTSTSAWVVP